MTGTGRQLVVATPVVAQRTLWLPLPLAVPVALAVPVQLALAVPTGITALHHSHSHCGKNNVSAVPTAYCAWLSIKRANGSHKQCGRGSLGAMVHALGEAGLTAGMRYGIVGQFAGRPGPGPAACSGQTLSLRHWQWQDRTYRSRLGCAPCLLASVGGGADMLQEA